MATTTSAVTIPEAPASSNPDLGTGSQATKEAFEFLLSGYPSPTDEAIKFVQWAQGKADTIRQAATNGGRARAGRIASNYVRWAGLGRAWLRAHGVQMPEPPTPADEVRAEMEAAAAAIEPPSAPAVSSESSPEHDAEVQKAILEALESEGFEDTIGLDSTSDADMDKPAFRNHIIKAGEDLLANLVATKDLPGLFRAPLLVSVPGFKTQVLFFSTVTLPLKTGKTIVRNVVVNGKTLKAKHPNILAMPNGQGFIRSVQIVAGKNERWVKAVVAEEGMIWRIFVTVDNRRSDPNTEYGMFRDGKVVQITQAEYRAIEDRMS